jgi:hypothetical protein
VAGAVIEAPRCILPSCRAATGIKDYGATLHLCKNNDLLVSQIKTSRGKQGSERVLLTKLVFHSESIHAKTKISRQARVACLRDMTEMKENYP